jgi:hypothetical protein
MSNLFVTSKQVRLNVPIPKNSKIAVTDVFFENRNYNIDDGGLELMVYTAPRQISAFLKRASRRGHWYPIKLWLTPGYYPNLKAFQKECLAASNNLKTFAERQIINHLFSRFDTEGGRLRIRSNLGNSLAGTYFFKIKFPKQLAEHLGLATPNLFINSLGMAEIDSSNILKWGGHIKIRRYAGPPLRLIDFESRTNFSIKCEEVDTALAPSKDICTTFFKKQTHTKEYIQPRNITFRKLTDNDHSTLTFSWPESVNLIFFNLAILTD